MDYGFGIPTRGPLANPEDIAAIAAAGERLGFAYASVNDHIVLPRAIASRYPYSETGAWPGGAAGDWLEPLGLLCFLAGVTRQVRLITSVLVLPYRAPLPQAKLLTTIDVLSGGRLTIGCGVGWLREEFEALEVGPFAERGRIADDYLAAFRELWTQEAPRFAGRHVRFSDIAFAPKPVQTPHPPLWIGGESPAALARAARLGDGWYPIGINPQYPLDTAERYAAAVADLRRRAEAAGRDPAALTLAYFANWYGDPKLGRTDAGGRRAFTGAPEEIAADIARFREIGVRHLVLSFNRPTRDAVIDAMEAFMREVAARV